MSNSIYMAELSPSARLRGADGAVLFFSEPIPDWYTCNADKFIDYYLRGMDSGIIPRPTKEELSKLGKGVKVDLSKLPTGVVLGATKPRQPKSKMTPKRAAPGRPPRFSDGQIVRWLDEHGSSSTGFIAAGMHLNDNNMAKRLRRLCAEGQIEKCRIGNSLTESEYIFWRVKKAAA